MSDPIKPEDVNPSIKALTFTLAQVNRDVAEHYTRVRNDLSAATSFYSSHVTEEVTRVLAERQAAEDVRANRRNRNNLLKLLVVLAMELVLPTLISLHVVPIWMVTYEVLVITAPDIALTVYAYFRRY